MIVPDKNYGRISQSFGGVARNVAEASQRLGAQTALLSCVGDDNYGRQAIDAMKKYGLVG
jgi:pseudouridine kinase